MSGRLKLAVTDEGDLAVVSAHLQDAIMLVGDIKYDPKHKNIIFMLNRFDWAGAQQRAESDEFSRCRCALRFDRVEAVKIHNIRMDAKMAVLSLLNIGFEGADLPSGHVIFNFSGGGAIRLDVECIEARLADLGPEWQTSLKPVHDDAIAPEQAEQESN